MLYIFVSWNLRIVIPSNKIFLEFGSINFKDILCKIKFSILRELGG